MLSFVQSEAHGTQLNALVCNAMHTRCIGSICSVFKSNQCVYLK